MFAFVRKLAKLIDPEVITLRRSQFEEQVDSIMQFALTFVVVISVGNICVAVGIIEKNS